MDFFQLADFETLSGSLSSQSSVSSRSYDMAIVIAFAVVGASLLIFLLAFFVIVFICRSKWVAMATNILLIF